MTHKHTPTLYAFKRYVTDKENFAMEENGTRWGDTPNFGFLCNTPEQADFIVKACNSHAALVEALVALEARAVEMRKLIDPKTWSDLENMATVEIINARAALALAKGE